MSWRDVFIAGAPDPELATRIADALDEFLLAELPLLERDVDERSITSRLTQHIAAHTNGWDVDAEYNRDGHEVKRANGAIVRPDVIVHRRGTPDNLLVIEVKKSNSAVSDEADIEKLRSFRSCHLAYRYALFIKFRVGTRVAIIERFEWV